MRERQGLQGPGCLLCQQWGTRVGASTWALSKRKLEAGLTGERVKWSGRSGYRSVWPPQGQGESRKLCVCGMHCTSNCSGDAASGVCTSGCQQWGDWDAGAATGQDWVSEPSCCGDPRWNFISITEIYTQNILCYKNINVIFFKKKSITGKIFLHVYIILFIYIFQ